MFRYKLRTLLILLALGPPALAGVWVLAPALRFYVEWGVWPSPRGATGCYAPLIEDPEH